MTDYIDRKAAIDAVLDVYYDIPDIDLIGEKFEAAILNIQAADVAPVRHGRWVYYSTTMQECSNCQRHTARHKFKYCPHCGAIMEDKYHESAD